MYIAGVKIQDLVTAYLLQHHECILPGIGVFKVNHNPACYDETSQLMLPSAEEIVFRETSGHHAVDLVAFIALKKKVSHQQAEEMLREFCREAKDNIKDGVKFIIETFGSLQKNAAGNIYFSRDKSPVFFEPVKADIVYEEDASPDVEPAISGDHYHPELPSGSYWWVWAMVLFVIAVVIIFYHFTSHPFTANGIGNVTG